MCDTLVALPDFTSNKSLIFAKNSDREPNEAQAIAHITRKHHSEEFLHCTFISIPQVKETNEVILSKPFQMWGAEMGVNEFGLVIGNEAVFTRVKINKKNNGLTGMDLLRLALERTKNAKVALNCIIELLGKYGQDACGGYKNKNFFYHNSFIIADPNEAYILETAGKSWASKKIENFGSISNGLGITSDFDRLHLEKEKLVFPFNLQPKPNPFSFQGYFSDFLYTKVGRAKARQACSADLLAGTGGDMKLSDAIRILQTHHLPDPIFNPKKANTSSLCMHGTGITNPSNTTGSMIAEIRKDKPSSIWLTGTSMPCISIFIPFFFGTHTIQKIIKPESSYDNSLWWTAEKLHQWICKDYQHRKSMIFSELNEIQKSFLENEKRLLNGKPSIQELENFSNSCLEQVKDFYERNLKKVY
ncbi:carcinine hydrolase/isopenicillin-N N-acyltransferase family protein [Shivajiella indica]|uniref:Carcinine hydrolase/isopenicillin-N N-acyltransferase family protein n=1 Tax=Shivajiella indica TaxID=872115 RepID=A0ABW5BB23_9BACT